MIYTNIRQYWLEYALMSVWLINCIIASIIAVREVWVPYMDAGTDSYWHIRSLPFDGTVMPIAYIPDWTKVDNQDKKKTFENIEISDYIPLPTYDAQTLLKDMENTQKMSTILHYTYTVPYMWSYKFNYKEHDGSHLWVDIRAPIWTPVLSIANWVVVRTVEADSTGNKFVVIRHDDVPLDGKKVSLYSWYLHLSQIHATEWTRIRKWEMLWRVGITWIATTPHLHFQIDRAEAPFHPYWPFTSNDSKNSWLAFFESVNAWLWKENALKYTIHPMNFVNKYLWGFNTNTLIPPTEPIGDNISVTSELLVTEEQSIREREIMLGNYISSWEKTCEQKRFSDISVNSTFWKTLYDLVDWNCLFQKDWLFGAKDSITLREWIMTIMDYYKIVPTSWTSHFLDLSIDDELQWYALVLYRKWLIDWNYLYPDKIITKAEAIDLIVKIWWIQANPGQIRVYPDIETIHPYFSSIQAYGFAIRARGWRIYPNSILNRGTLVQLLSSLRKITK